MNIASLGPVVQTIAAAFLFFEVYSGFIEIKQVNFNSSQ